MAFRTGELTRMAWQRSSVFRKPASAVRSILIPGLLLAMSASGCLYEIRDEVNDCEFNMRNSCTAHSAWRQHRDCYGLMDHRKDFKAGFIAGYKASAFGGDGCPPSLPPPHYWKVCYASPEGKARANAWFDGYSQGAFAARQDGIADMNQIVTRGANRSNMMQVEMPTTSGPQPTPAVDLPDPAAELLPEPDPASDLRN
jgi:hypothetical protein